MFVKLIEVISITQLYENLKGLSLPIKTLYKLNCLKKESDFHLIFYNDNLLKIIEEYAERDDNGELKRSIDGSEILINKEKVRQCQDRINELLNLDIEIPDTFFSIEEFNNIEMTLEEFQGLLPFIKE